MQNLEYSVSMVADIGFKVNPTCRYIKSIGISFEGRHGVRCFLQKVKEEKSMIIVTGGAGFIGSVFIKKCNDEGIDDILIVDRLSDSEKWRNLVDLSYVDFIHKDDFPVMLDANLAKNIDAIIHMGACSATTETDGDYLMRNNFHYTKNLAMYCMEHDIRFIYASSAATYGDGEEGFSDHHDTIPSLRPINRYGYSKQLFDHLAYKKEWLDAIVGLKFFNVFGPNETHKGAMKSVVCKAYTQINNTGQLNLFKSYNDTYPDGGQMRDFVYVLDIAEILFWLMQNPSVNGIFNVGAGKARTWNDLANAVFSAMNVPLKINYIDMPEDIRGHYQYYTEADMTKLKNAGCPVVCRSIEDGVRDYVLRYLHVIPAKFQKLPV